ncbi:hypothetical protein L1987_16967 [Smallanthus sonchifolius]|uniref:Uncharacterized protein n=1 Tax=Smallanthus sonchifolius TaxID=185202 RepID=A0ACB9IXL5_9ASTR|nr:hypothetical protein L1987_16967 [Smallanthus sonchifolius]
MSNKGARSAITHIRSNRAREQGQECRELERDKKVENWEENVDGTMIVFHDKEKAGGSKTKNLLLALTRNNRMVVDVASMVVATMVVAMAVTAPTKVIFEGIFGMKMMDDLVVAMSLVVLDGERRRKTRKWFRISW